MKHYYIFIFIALISCNNKIDELKQTNKCIDNHGRSYQSVLIGKQIWMSENLAYLPSINKKYESSNNKAKYYIYEYNGVNTKEAKEKNNFNNYGVLYNYEAALESIPEGWHLPSDKEWQELEIYLGILKEQINNSNFRGSEDISIKIRSKTMWKNNNGIDYYGINIYPAGILNDTFFRKEGYSSFFWTSNNIDETNAWAREVSYVYPGINRTKMNKRYGLSIRCIKN